MIVTALRELGADPTFVNGGVIAALGRSSGLGDGRALRGRGGRVRRLVPALRHRCRPHHQRRRRPSRPLRHRGAFEDAFVAFAGAARVRRRSRRRRRRPARCARGSTGTGHRPSERPTRGRAGARRRAAARSRSHSSYLGARTRRASGSRRAQRAQCRGCVRGADRARPRSGARDRARLEIFEGTGRRFELHGEVRGVSVYDDYAHHPTEVEPRLCAARDPSSEPARDRRPPAPPLQPDPMMAGDFAATYEALADHTIVLDVFGAREDPVPGSPARWSPSGSPTRAASTTCPTGSRRPTGGPDRARRRPGDDAQLRRRLPDHPAGAGRARARGGRRVKRPEGFDGRRRAPPRRPGASSRRRRRQRPKKAPATEAPKAPKAQRARAARDRARRPRRRRRGSGARSRRSRAAERGAGATSVPSCGGSPHVAASSARWRQRGPCGRRADRPARGRGVLPAARAARHRRRGDLRVSTRRRREGRRRPAGHAAGAAGQRHDAAANWPRSPSSAATSTELVPPDTLVDPHHRTPADRRTSRSATASSWSIPPGVIISSSTTSPTVPLIHSSARRSTAPFTSDGRRAAAPCRRGAGPGDPVSASTHDDVTLSLAGTDAARRGGVRTGRRSRRPSSPCSRLHANERAEASTTSRLRHVAVFRRSPAPISATRPRSGPRASGRVRPYRDVRQQVVARKTLNLKLRLRGCRSVREAGRDIEPELPRGDQGRRRRRRGRQCGQPHDRTRAARRRIHRRSTRMRRRC